MKWGFLGAFVALAACGSDLGGYAAECEITETELRRGMEEVSAMRPYSGREIGRCGLIVDDVRNVVVITPKISAAVEKMIK